MYVQQIFPDYKILELSELTAGFAGASVNTLTPFSESAIEFCARLSHRLIQNPIRSSFPELAALGFWMRPAAIERLKKHFTDLTDPRTLRMPVGTVLHLPPSNVETIFVYSCVVSLLCGNSNIIRLSRKSSPVINTVLENIADVLSDGSLRPIRNMAMVISYGHEFEITRALSSLCDLRVVWGGDETVGKVRSVPLPAHAREIAFPDRYSCAAILADAFMACSEKQKEEAAENFFRDAYFFDQMACSSPKLILWVGDREKSFEAGEKFYGKLSDFACASGYVPDMGSSLNKLGFSHQAILDMPVSARRCYGPQLTVLTLKSLDSYNRQHCGGGLFYEFICKSLDELTAFVSRKEQSLSYFGFDVGEIKRIAGLIGARGFSHFVPFGQALKFHEFWDGHDLFRDMTKVSYIQ